jgi:hypothetical protein
MKLAKFISIALLMIAATIFCLEGAKEAMIYAIWITIFFLSYLLVTILRSENSTRKWPSVRVNRSQNRRLKSTYLIRKNRIQKEVIRKIEPGRPSTYLLSGRSIPKEKIRRIEKLKLPQTAPVQNAQVSDPRRPSNFETVDKSPEKKTQPSRGSDQLRHESEVIINLKVGTGLSENAEDARQNALYQRLIRVNRSRKNFHIVSSGCGVCSRVLPVTGICRSGCNPLEE